MDKIAKKRGRPKGSKNKERHRKEDDEEKSEIFNESIQDMATKMESFRNSILQKLKVELFGGGQNLQIPPSNIKHVISTLVNSSIHAQNKNGEDVNIKENILKDGINKCKKIEQKNINPHNLNLPQNDKQFENSQSIVDNHEKSLSSNFKKQTQNEATCPPINEISETKKHNFLPNNSVENLNSIKSKVDKLCSSKLHKTRCSNQEDVHSELSSNPSPTPTVKLPPQPLVLQSTSAKTCKNTDDESSPITKCMSDQLYKSPLIVKKNTSICHANTVEKNLNYINQKTPDTISSKSVKIIEERLNSLVLSKDNQSTEGCFSSKNQASQRSERTALRASNSFAWDVESLERLHSSFSSFCEWKAKKNKYMKSQINLHASTNSDDYNCVKEKINNLNCLNVNRKNGRKEFLQDGVNLSGANAFFQTANETIRKKHNDCYSANASILNTDKTQWNDDEHQRGGDEANKNDKTMMAEYKNKQTINLKNKKVQCDIGRNRTLVDTCSQTSRRTTTNNSTQTHPHSTCSTLSSIPDERNPPLINAMNKNISFRNNDIAVQVGGALKEDDNGGNAHDVSRNISDVSSKTSCVPTEGGCSRCKHFKDKLEECEQLQNKLKFLQQELALLKQQKLHQSGESLSSEIYLKTPQNSSIDQQQYPAINHQQHPATNQQKNTETNQQKNTATNQPDNADTYDDANPANEFNRIDTPSDETPLDTHKQPPSSAEVVQSSEGMKSSPTLVITPMSRVAPPVEDPHQMEHPQHCSRDLLTSPIINTSSTHTTPKSQHLLQLPPSSQQFTPNNIIPISILDSTFLNNLLLSTPIISKNLSINLAPPKETPPPLHGLPHGDDTQPCKQHTNLLDFTFERPQVPSNEHKVAPLFKYPHTTISSMSSPTTSSSSVTSTTSMQPLTSLPISIPLDLLCSQKDSFLCDDYDEDLYTVIEESIEDKSLENDDVIAINDTLFNNDNADNKNKEGSLASKNTYDVNGDFIKQPSTSDEIDAVTSTHQSKGLKRPLEVSLKESPPKHACRLGEHEDITRSPGIPNGQKAMGVMKLEMKLNAEDLLNSILSNEDLQISDNINESKPDVVNVHDTSHVAGPVALSDNTFNNHLHKVPPSYKPFCNNVKNIHKVSSINTDNKSHKLNGIMHEFLNDDDDDDSFMSSRSKQVSRKRNRSSYGHNQSHASIKTHDSTNTNEFDSDTEISSKNKKVKIDEDAKSNKNDASSNNGDHPDKINEVIFDADTRRERKMKSPVYKKVKKCTYVDVRPTCKDKESSRCECDPGENRVPCGEDCLNRMVYTECCPTTCPMGERCTNQRMQRKEWQEGLEKFVTTDRGYGVRCSQAIKTGKFIIEYCGEVVSEGEFKRRMMEEYVGDKHHYCLHLDSGTVIDGYRVGNISRFINHSCQPNCHMEKWNVNGIYRVGLFSLQDIPPNTELTYDYNFHSYNSDAQQVCKCGSSGCRGVMGERKQKMNQNVVAHHKTNNNDDVVKNRKNNSNNNEVVLKGKKNKRPGRNGLGYLKASTGEQKTRSSSFSSPSSLRSFPSFSSLKQLDTYKPETKAAKKINLKGFSNDEHPKITTHDKTYVLARHERSMIHKSGIFLIRNCKKVHSKKHNKLNKNKLKSHKVKNIASSNMLNCSIKSSSCNTSNSVKSVGRNRTRTNNELREALRLKQQASTRHKFGLFLTKLPGFRDMFDLKIKLIKKRQQEASRAPNNLVRRRSASEERDENLKNIFANIVCILREALEVPDHLRDHPALQLFKVNSTLPRKEAIERPQDLQTIYNNIMLRHYNCIQSLNKDFIFLFAAIQEKIGFNCEVEDIVGNMKKVYREAAKDALELYKGELEKYGLLKENQSDKLNETAEEYSTKNATADGDVSMRNSSVNDVKKFEVLNNKNDPTTNKSNLNKTQVSNKNDPILKPSTNENKAPTKSTTTPANNPSTKAPNLDDVSSIDDEEEEEEEDEVIRCVCNIYKDEGLMVQCEKCETWQHCMCMGVKGDEERYMCELCEPRSVNKEVLLVPQPDDALLHCRYYLTLVRSDKVQVRVTECVYVSREGCDVTIDDLNLHPGLRDQLDIFRVERLWRKYNGEGCVFGHYYVRPQETFHEPHRRFFPNELFKAPIFHLVPLEAVVAPCCVLDLATYSLGRPREIKQEDVYICEYRVDKTARLFSRISRNRHHTNKASYCFVRHPHKLKPKRTLTAHELANRRKEMQ